MLTINHLFLMINILLLIIAVFIMFSAHNKANLLLEFLLLATSTICMILGGYLADEGLLTLSYMTMLLFLVQVIIFIANLVWFAYEHRQKDVTYS